MSPVAVDWGRVAAPGTDPTLLARVAHTMAADPAGFHGRWRDAQSDDIDPGPAVRLAAGQDVLDTGPGDRAAQAWADRGVRVALAGDPGMPERIDAVAATPPLLATRTGAVDGSMPTPGGHGRRPAVAIVGSRRASGYGTAVASWLAEAAGGAGIHVVSGGAVGIDAAAHDAAMDTVGATTVVLGCGHAVDYPRPHARAGGLFDRVRGAGGHILSESLPFETARPHRVRSRNRLIAALSDVVVVVEGGARSGALITATWAADYGIQVMAVPGDVRAPGSAAGLQLLRDGAGVCAGPDDLLAAVTAASPAATTPVPADGADTTPDRSEVTILPEPVAAALAQAWPRPLSLADLAGSVDMSIGALMAAVTRAQVAGTLTRDLEGLRLRRQPGS